MTSQVLEVARLLGLALGAGAVALALDTLLAVPCPEFETHGRRAGNRLRALRESAFFPLGLHLIRFFTGYAVLLRAPRLRAELEVYLRQADEPLGLVPSEVMGLCILCAVGGALLGAAGVQPLCAVPGALLGGYFPYAHLRAQASQRVAEVAAAVPIFTDLMVLTMESGMDFISSVRLLLAKTDSSKGTMPLRDELRIFLYQLDLGMTRRAALLAFAARCPAEPVESFVTAIIQAEEKGMSLRDVLRIQADVLRQKRIQDAIAYIDTANLHMMAPVMLIIVALMIVILAPVLLNMKSVMGGGVEGLP